MGGMANETHRRNRTGRGCFPLDWSTDERWFWRDQTGDHGRFLRAGNTTLLVGVEDDRFEAAMAIIEKVCKSRKQLAPSPASMVGMPGAYTPYPIEVVVGGATIFVLTVDQFVKL